MASFQVDGATIPLLCESSSNTSNSRNTSFRWDEAKDKILIREVRLQEPYIERVGSKEAGLKWTEIANCLNAHPLFKDCTSLRDQRSVRERFNRLLSDFNSKMRKEESSSGSSPPDLTEVEKALEEIQNILVTSTQNKPQEVQVNERSKAMQMRDKAMKTWSKQTDEDNSDSEGSSDSVVDKSRSSRKRRRGSDALDYLQTRQSSDQEIKREEIEIKKQQVAVEEKKIELELKKQEQMQAILIEQQRQAAINQQQQQQQLNQQMQMQSQMLSLLAKMANQHNP